MIQRNIHKKDEVGQNIKPKIDELTYIDDLSRDELWKRFQDINISYQGKDREALAKEYKEYLQAQEKEDIF